MTVFAATVSRAASYGGPTPLDLRSAYTTSSNPIVGLFIDDPEEIIDPGTVVWKRWKAESPVVDGDMEVHATLGPAEGKMTVVVLSATAAQQKVMLNELIVAIHKQPTWTLQASLDGELYAWSCERADYSIRFNKRTIHGRSAKVAFSFPRKPIPILGPV